MPPATALPFPSSLLHPNFQKKNQILQDEL